MTREEAELAGDLVRAHRDFAHDLKALRACAERHPGRLVEVSFWDNDGNSIATGTKLPPATAALFVESLMGRIDQQLGALGVTEPQP
jgi:hypothetical protein